MVSNGLGAQQIGACLFDKHTFRPLRVYLPMLRLESEILELVELGVLLIEALADLGDDEGIIGHAIVVGEALPGLYRSGNPGALG